MNAKTNAHEENVLSFGENKANIHRVAALASVTICKTGITFHEDGNQIAALLN